MKSHAKPEVSSRGIYMHFGRGAEALVRKRVFEVFSRGGNNHSLPDDTHIASNRGRMVASLSRDHFF